MLQYSHGHMLVESFRRDLRCVLNVDVVLAGGLEVIVDGEVCGE